MAEMAKKLFVFALDGGSFQALQSFLDDGLMPTLKSFMTDGSWGNLESVLPPFTVPAWTAFRTGTGPGKTGVYDFIRRIPNSYDDTIVFAKNIVGTPFWNILKDKRLLLLNLPLTWPAEPINGRLITDFLTPPHKKEASFPAELLQEVEQKFGPYRFAPNMPERVIWGIGGGSHYGDQYFEGLAKDITAMTHYKFNVCHYLLDKEPYDLVIFHIIGVDRLCHECWSAMVDRQHPHRGAVEEYLRLVDAQFKTLLERLGPDFTTMIVSDHGFGSIDKVLNLNTWLLQEGYIKIRPTWLARARRAFWKAGITGNAELLLLHRIFMGLQAKGWVNFIGARAGFELLVRRFNLSFSFNDIDWPRTKCWAPPGLGQMMINLKGREPQGCVAPEEYEQLRQELIGKLKSLTDPENGRPLNLEVYTREEAYHGNQSHLATDLVIYGNETGYFVYDSRHFHRPTPIYRNNCFPSSHRRAGIFLMKGSNIRPGRQIHGARMIDIAPTILHLFQQPIPAEMDGQVLGDVFENIGNIAHQQATGADTHPDQSIRISEEDEAMIQARLRGLGYID